MKRRPATLLVTVAFAVSTAAACTGGSASDSSPSSGPPGTSGTAAEQGPSATVAAPQQEAVVAAGRTPGAVSVAVSAQLFDAAPTVVVAPAGDPAAIRTAAGQAEKLGVPLLLDDGTGTAVKAEIGRLRATTVLAADPEVGARAGGEGTKVAADLAGVTGSPPAGGLDKVAVLVAAGGDPATRAGAAAATATARAAGAAVVPVRGSDPRADPAAIAALAKAPPDHVVGAGTGFGSAERLAARVAVAATGRQLPGGGQVVLPGRRLVALYGHPGTPGLGVLGEQPVDAAIARAKRIAEPYRALSGSLPVVPAFEIIATVATAPPGPDGNFSFEAPISQLKPWVEKAGAAGLYVVLDLQPGRTDFLTQAKRYEPLLKLPYVGLALDPEWRLKPGEKHLSQIGSVSAREINSVYGWLADLTAKNTLPQKLFVLHQFRLSMIGSDQPLARDRDEVALLIHMDGQGPPGSKDETWRAVVGAAPKGVPFGWKNFYDEDVPMLSPAQTMIKRPAPVMISYQ